MDQYPRSVRFAMTPSLPNDATLVLNSIVMVALMKITNDSHSLVLKDDLIWNHLFHFSLFSLFLLILGHNYQTMEEYADTPLYEF